MAFITINKQNFYHNLNQIALKTGSVDKIAIVLKDNAYGHGLVLMANLASEFGIKHAVVRTIEEAEQMQSLFETILVLGDTAVKHPVYSFTMNSLEDITCAQKGAKVELKVDTGMHRNGICIDELDFALEQIEKKELELVGVMTHYRSADVLSSEFFWQKKCFESVKDRVSNAGFENVRFHSYNSASLLRTQHFEEDLVRVGISAYGYNELPNIFTKIELKAVLSLYANKVATRVLKKGERLGYGGDYVAPHEMIVSTYDVGYGDGWPRGNSHQSFITSENLPILGRVSMDFITLESEKEEICVMNNAKEAAQIFDTISYDIITGLQSNIQKKVLGG
ncbi:MAG: alanine racemase [Sulfurovum sp.]|nr:MAG: alanine racemase [Sulfurovum sp.]